MRKSKNPLTETYAQIRDDLEIGLLVDIVLKEDQRSGKLTRGVIREFLTSKDSHPNGIKVRLENNLVGRVVKVYYKECYGILFLNKNGAMLQDKFYSLFKSIYHQNKCWIINENTNFTDEFKNDILTINYIDIDFILQEDALDIFTQNFKHQIGNYSQNINKKIKIYLYREGKLINVNTGREKKYKKID